LATTPIRIGSKLYIADIEPLLAWVQRAMGLLDFPGFTKLLQALA
jgi:hypothetical protein